MFTIKIENIVFETVGRGDTLARYDTYLGTSSLVVTSNLAVGNIF